jgi:hypothetical protein
MKKATSEEGNIMKIVLISILLTALVFVSTSTIRAQGTTSAAQNAENLRAQLADVQAKEFDLQSRAQLLDEALRPENIERALAGIGSTRPEELREQRRRLLNNEKAGVVTQLEQLAASRARLESAILNADGLAYQQSAQGTADTQLNMMSGSKYLASHRWLAGMLMASMAILGLVALIVAIRRRQLP